MDFMIDENKLDGVVGKFLDRYFKDEEINYTHPYDVMFDEETGGHYEGENPEVLIYYIGDYDEDDYLFKIYFEGYWSNTTEAGQKRISESPLLTMDDELYNTLDGMFGDNWKQGFRKWFKNKYDIEVNKIR